MNDFEYYCPTRIVFGKNAISKLPALMNAAQKVLMLYGGGSVKTNGVYAAVKTALKGFDVVEFGGIEANPTYETCMKAVAYAKQEQVGFLLAVGGGSVLDATKFIAAALKYEGADPYDILAKGTDIIDAMPLGDVMTLPATGSEMNDNAVISKRESKEKLLFSSPYVYPRFSVIDPSTTFSLPQRQTVNGIVDTFVHVMELYCTFDVDTPLQDAWALGLLRTLVGLAPKVLANPTDYNTRANMFWCATCGLNYWIALGAVQDWSTHMIGHELTAFYGIDHGQSLAVVLPRLLMHELKGKQEKLAKLGRTVFGIAAENDATAAVETVTKIETFFKSLGMKTRLADYGIKTTEAAEKIRDRFAKRGLSFGEKKTITAQAAFEILSAC